MMDRWEYLISNEFYIRKVIAAHYLKNCNVVVDVGCYKQKLPIYDGILHSIDPLGTVDGAFHGTFKEWYMNNIHVKSGTGVCLLGFDFSNNEEEIQCLLRFLQSTDVIVLEHAFEFEESSEQCEKIMNNIPHKISSWFIMDLPRISVPGFPVYGKRKMYILERG